MIATTNTAEDDRIERFVEGTRVLVVGGIPTGALVVGLGSRLAMLLLRVTSPDRVIGRTSDDDFVIGRFTLAGTYNLLVLGAAVGIIGAGTYRMVAPWLIGPNWFRRLTTGLAAGAVGGAMLVHPSGIDFTVLQPTWLAIGLFVALPGLFGTLIGPAVDAVSRPGSWTNRGRRRWLVPLVAIGCFPTSLLIVVAAALILGIMIAVGNNDAVKRVRRARTYALTVRAAWLFVAAVGLVALVNDTRALT